jgi:hypothetical protein
MQRLGLAWNVVRITPERQLAKTAVDRTSDADRMPAADHLAGLGR